MTAALFDNTQTNDIDDALNACEEETQNSGGGQQERNFIKLKEGPEGNKLRILPPLKGFKTPWHHVMVHFGLMGSDGKQMAIKCSFEQFNKCALCDDSRLKREHGDQLAAWNASAKDYYLYNALDEGNNYAIYSADKKQQMELIKVFKFARSADGGVYNPWDIDNGCQIKVVKTKGPKRPKQKFAPNLFAMHLLVRKPVDAVTLDLASSKMSNLSEVYQTFTPEQIAGMLDGTFDPYAEKRAKKEEQEGIKPKTEQTQKPVQTLAVGGLPTESGSVVVSQAESSELDNIMSGADDIAAGLLSDDI